MVGWGGLALPAFTQTRPPRTSPGPKHYLKLTATIPLPLVKGGFDLMAVDVAGQRLFVAAQDNHTVEVVDLRHARPLASIAHLQEPKWVVYRPELNRLFVSTALDARVTALTGDTYRPVATYAFKERCNNLRYDARTRELYVGVGNTFGALGVINLRLNKVTGSIPLADFPKQFELDGNRIYVNVPRRNVIQVVDRATRRVVATWPVPGATENVPMALDRLHHRLVVACEPGELLIFSTLTGKPVARLPIAKEADGVYYDARRRRIYVSCGAGSVAVIGQDDPDHYRPLDQLPTRPGAGTSLYSPELDVFIVALPQVGPQPAAIQVYRPAA